MALSKSGFADAITGTASFKLDCDANGNLITNGSSATVGGSKRIAFSNINAGASKAQANAVADVFFKTLVGTNSAVTPDSLQTTFKVSWTGSDS